MSRSTSSSSTDDRPEGLLEIGHVRRAHGLAGEVFVQLTSTLDERLGPGSRLVAADGTEYVVERSRRASNGRRVVKFAHLADRTAAERALDTALYAEPLDDPDALWAHELIDAEVVEVDGTVRGRCVAVIANPAADLLELDTGDLVPTNFITAFDGGRIVVDAPAGLFATDEQPGGG
jgi:16S rRNA processing protein RimM